MPHAPANGGTGSDRTGRHWDEATEEQSGGSRPFPNVGHARYMLDNTIQVRVLRTARVYSLLVTGGVPAVYRPSHEHAIPVHCMCS